MVTTPSTQLDIYPAANHWLTRRPPDKFTELDKPTKMINAMTILCPAYAPSKYDNLTKPALIGESPGDKEPVSIHLSIRHRFLRSFERYPARRRRGLILGLSSSRSFPSLQRYRSVPPPRTPPGIVGARSRCPARALRNGRSGFPPRFEPSPPPSSSSPSVRIPPPRAPTANAAAAVVMFQFYSSDGPKFGEEAAEIERFRARHRRLCRGQQPDATPSPQVQDLDVEDGRTRKISAKWRQQHHQVPPVSSNQFDDATWATDAEMHVGFNAFDFSTAPEAFYEPEQQQQQQLPQLDESKAPSCHDNQVEQEQDDAALRSTSLWERRFPGVQKSGGPIRQLPTLGQDALWGGPVHYASQEAQRRAVYYQPQYYA